MKNENSKSIIIIAIGLILWILYHCDSEMSRYGIYTIFSYNVHELLSGVPYICFVSTICWLIFIIAKIVRKKDIKTNVFFSILLIVLCVPQTIYINNEYQIISSSFVTSIESIDKEKQEVIINTEGYDLTLNCPMLVQDLLKTDGTKYIITYQWKKTNPHYGNLCMIQSAD